MLHIVMLFIHPGVFKPKIPAQVNNPRPRQSLNNLRKELHGCAVGCGKEYHVCIRRKSLDIWFNKNQIAEAGEETVYRGNALPRMPPGSDKCNLHLRVKEQKPQQL